jgi:hypothetical protein
MHSQREGAELQIRGTWSAGPGDDQARFLADLRALRDSAALGYDELAARAHYPSDILKEAENGPYLPSLPILTAYVRACEGDVLDWEERWRRLNPEAEEDPSLPVRPAGASAAAVAGARAGVGVAPPDVYDPERIRAALRGGKTRSGQPSRRANHADISAPVSSAARLESPQQEAGSGTGLSNGASRSANSGWDTTADPTITSANGNHSAEHGSRGPFDAVFTAIPDSAEPAEPAQPEDFSWLKKSTPESESADGGFGWSGQADHGRTAQPTDSGFTWPERADTGLAAQPEANPALPEPADTERIPRYQADGLTAQERTDFWAKPTTSVSADLQLPTAAARAEETAIRRASWPAPADTATTPAAEPAHRAPADAAVGAAVAASGSAQPFSSAGSAAQATVSQQDHRRQDRIFPVRLLVVIIIAALIGSALVLLLK